MEPLDPKGNLHTLETAGSLLLFPAQEANAITRSHETLSGGNIVSLAEELHSAGRVQRSLLPRQLPVIKGWDVSAFCLAAGPIGGDFYDVLHLSSQRILLLVADVMGKGIPAALIASVLRTAVRNVARTAEGPGEILRRVNELIYEDLANADMFVTAQLALFDTVHGTGTIGSAGHCALLLKTSAGAVEEVCPAGVPIGVAPNARYEEEVLDLGPLTHLLMYTDGLTEARNRSGDLFGIGRLQDWLRSAGCIPAEALKQQLVAHLEAFGSDARRRDDQSFLVVSKTS